MLYAKYEYLKELEKEQVALEKFIESGNPKTTLRRMRDRKFYYYEIKTCNGKSAKTEFQS